MGLSQAPGTTQTSAVERGVSERKVQATGEQTRTKQAQRMSGGGCAGLWETCLRLTSRRYCRGAG
jgi:hypothetical protein